MIWGKGVHNAKESSAVCAGVSPAYLYADEEEQLEARAGKERWSKSEIIRRALRAYLGMS